MPKQRHVNTFQNGMRRDVDILNQPEGSYRYSLNGRIVFNQDGTYSWQTELGSRISFEITEDYIPIGYTGQSNLVVLFSVEPVSGNSEIGIFILDKNDNGTYKVLFNDSTDPNGDLLTFLPTNQIEARFVYENDSCIRAYWVDGVNDDSNAPRVFTFSYDDSIGPVDDVNAYSAVSTSVHSMNSQAEFSMGLMKYVFRISGNLLTGVYQYTYRLATNDGYRTPWYPLTRPVFITSDELDPVDWWKYEMEGVGQTSAKGNRIEIKGVDQRFSEIEVAYVYSQTDTQPLDSNIFAIVEIDSDVMTFDHVTNDGEPLQLEEIPAFFQGIRKAKTLNIKDATLYYGNIVEGGFDVDPELLLQNVSVQAYFRDMRSDEKNMTTYESTAGAPPISHGNYTSGTTTKRLHNAIGGDEVYQIGTDYLNYKGTQVSHLYKGYFRGETYRFGIVFFDKLGFQSFVYHLADVVMPHQSELTYSASRIKTDNTIAVVPTVPLAERAWTTNNYGDYTSPPVLDGEDTSLGTYSHLRILGLKFSGIDVSPIVNQISGFMIVRVERDKTILAQGLLYPCVKEDDITRPLPYPVQQWANFNPANPDPGDSIAYYGAGWTVSDVELINANMMAGNDQGTSHNTTRNYIVRPNISAFYSPNVFFGAGIDSLNTQDQLKLVGGCYADDNPNLVGNEAADVNQYFTYALADDDGLDVIQKMYYSKNDYHVSASEPYPDYLDAANPVESFSVGLGGSVPDYAPGLDLENSIQFEGGQKMGFHDDYLGGPWQNRAWGMGGVIFYRHTDFGPNVNGVNNSPYYVSNYPGISPYNGVFICNYTRPNAGVYGGQSLSALERNIFFSTGHFQPVNNTTFTTPGSLVFDEVEVWGGDCILDYFGFLRAYGRYNPDNDWDDRVGTGGLNSWSGAGTPDYYSLGVIFPLESELHHPLRNAPSDDNPIYPSVGARPHSEYDTSNSTNWPNGLFVGKSGEAADNLREEFNINEVLLFEEDLMFYVPKPIRFKDNFRFPTRWRYTLPKFYGDTVDTWRVFQVNDFDDLNGRYGAITSSEYLFDQIYSFQEGAFGRLRASDRALVESANQGSLTTGVGGQLDGIDYINTTIGNQHQWSLFSSGKALYWVDVDRRKICRFAQDGFVPLSDQRQLHQWIEIEAPFYEDLDNPAYTVGIAGHFDFENQEAIFSFVRDRRLFIDNNSPSIVSERGIDYEDLIIDNNDLVETVGVNLGNSIVVPEGHGGAYGINLLKVFYVCHSNDSFGPLLVQTVDTQGTVSLLTSVANGACIRLYRNSINDPWSFETILLDDVSYKRYNTLKFNEIINAFSGFHSYQPNIMMNIKSNLLSHSNDRLNEIWVHNRYVVGSNYGVLTESLLGFVSNDNPVITKAFDNIKVNANQAIRDTFVNVLMFTELQYQDLIAQGDNRIEYKEDFLRYPLRTYNQVDRMRGKHIELLMQFSNINAKSVRISNTMVDYRPSPDYN
jgi:hypothetical protein